MAADLGGLVAGCYSVDGDRPVGELGNMWIRPSKIGTGLGRVLWQDAMATHGRPVRQAHAFFRHRTPDKMLVSAAPWVPHHVATTADAQNRMRCMMPDDPWLAAVWPFVRGQLPPARARVLEVGCGTLGGFVPLLVDGGYRAVGVDPEAPDGSNYHQVKLERYAAPQPVDCVVASLSLHHVADLEETLSRLRNLLVPGGVLVVVEWAWERFDEATARWCFARLTPPAPEAEPSWLHRHQEQWAASGQPWDGYCRGWAEGEGLHPGSEIVKGLDARFSRRLSAEGPYFFPDLADTSEAEEQAAIDAGQIRAGGIRYAATRA